MSVHHLERPPIRGNHDFLHVSRPVDIRADSGDLRIIPGHAGIPAGVVLIAFQPGCVDGHGARHVGQREQVPADGHLGIPGKRDPDHRLGRDTARIGNEGARCRDRDVICLQMEEWLTAEGHGEAAVRVPAQNLLKGNACDVYHLWVLPKDFVLPFDIHPTRDPQGKPVERGYDFSLEDAVAWTESEERKQLIAQDGDPLDAMLTMLMK